MLNVKIVRKSGGREVSASEFSANLKREVIEAAKEKVRQKIEAVRCPVHGTTGTAVLTENPNNDFGYGVTGCCDALGEAVKREFTTA